MGGGKQRPAKRTVSLAEQLHQDQFVTRQRSRQNRKAGDDGEEEGAKDVTRLVARDARRIVEASRRHLEDSDSDAEAVADADDDGMPPPDPTLAGAYDHHPDAAGGDAGDDDFGDVDLEYDDNESATTEVQEFDDLGNAYGISEEEQAAFDQFMPQSGMRSRNLADIIMAKINEKEARAAGELPEEEVVVTEEGSNVDARVRRVYSAIGNVLKRYTSGKIPKAFKVLPHVQNWEQLLFLTRPQEWSPHATYAATRIFASHLNEKMAQRYFNAVLLPIVHTSMEEERKLHPALFMAVRKALFKPVAFFKGFLLPLCNEGECPLREALAVGAVLQKMHLPPVPTAVVIVKITTLQYTPANGLFLRVLIDKKIALPYQAIDALVKYFHRFVHTHPKEEKLPVIWHQTLLGFSQNYKMDLTAEQLELLRQVCTKHFHHMITPEVRREIAAAQGKASSLH